MISFIVIAKNEEAYIARCLTSIYEGISTAGIRSYEIILVDSRSTDRTIDIALAFSDVRIMSVTGPSSCAINRNVGAKVAKGDVFFFIDGDMEIIPEFLQKQWDHSTDDLSGDFISGICLDVTNENENEKKRTTSKSCVGGVFLIRRNLWEKAGGMRTRFVNAEDTDFTIRLSRLGHHFKRMHAVIVRHNTVPYFQEPIIRNTIRTKHVFYCRSVMLRHHLFNRYMYRLLWDNDKTFILLTLAITSTALVPQSAWAMLILYTLAVALRVAKQDIYVPFLKMMRYYFLLDSLYMIYFFTLFPKDVKEEYITVR